MKLSYLKQGNFDLDLSWRMAPSWAEMGSWAVGKGGGLGWAGQGQWCL